MKKRLAFLYAMACMLVVASFLGTVPKQAAAESHPDQKDLIISSNIPQALKEVNGDQIQLHALHVYKVDGHFMETEALRWWSANPRVATVDPRGLVTLKGHSGDTRIFVTDGRKIDHTQISVKDHKGTKTAVIQKQKGKKYNVIPAAIKQMSMEEKVGQMLMPDFRTFNGKNVTEVTPEIKALVKKYHLGGIILFRENVVTTEQTTKLVADYQEASEKNGLLISIDQEGGIVTRLQSGTDFPGNMALGATRSPELAEKVGKAIGEELNALGINFNLSPSLDVNNNQDNPVIGTRSFGEDPQLVTDLGTAYIKGLQSTNTAGAAKHFPGHGDTAVDSHIGLPEVPYDLERLKKVELFPFQKAMDAGVDAIMTAHVTFPKVDPSTAISKKDGSTIAIPATLSHKVLTELMREDMGYKGVITTDAMNMQAISDNFGPVDSAIRAVNAGTDIVLMPVGLEAVANGLYDAVHKGEITQERLNQSVERLLTLKVKRSIFKAEKPADVNKLIENAQQVVGSPAHKQIEKETAEKSITLIKNQNTLPLSTDAGAPVVVIGNTYVEDLAAQVKRLYPNSVMIKAAGPLTADQLQTVKSAKAVIVGTYTSSVAGRAPDSAQMKMVNQVNRESDKPVIAVGIRNPYDIMSFPDVDAYLAQYSFRTASFAAVADTIFGKNNPSGKLPVTIYNSNKETLYPYGHGLSY
ncbi:glycoside hydrolase family 3 protein [Fictibacillus sp. KIGAM418]|uniref:beta-N-acetylhexosaminidase n=1 Tax=Fictibacillus marinisediminis TaxID=2878389 RepID=A0A9X1XEP3_9BACL|nr:glycoside hydrolase family 3 protein [Fictibacillus marinisediminis]MCK6258173.1 glycoside hydrolase family 3 protein [Fictibacillus marinisediminis]